VIVASPAPREDLETLLISVVADKTGYPAELLDSSLDLASDLGIDSIKRVEILAELRSRAPHLPEVGTAELGTLGTLGQIVERLREARPANREHASDGSPGGSGPAPPPVLVRTTRRAVESPACGLAMHGLHSHELCIVDGGSGLADHLVAALARHGVPARAAAADLPPAESRGVVLLGGLAEPGSAERCAEIQRDALRAARSVAAAYESGGGLFVTVQDTGGDFGLDGRAGSGAWLGGLAALARTAALEWPAAAVKAIDCERAGREPRAIAEAIACELLTGGPTREVGLRADGTRLTLAEAESPADLAAPAARSAAATPPRPAALGPESVIVVTGGARGITSSCLLELASLHKPRLVLLGRTVPEPEPGELRGIEDEAQLNRALAADLARRTGRAARPAELRARVEAVRAAREIQAAQEALRAAGAQVRYIPVDVRDGAAVAAALTQVRDEWGPITGVIHGAGVIADRRIAQKTDDDFERVFQTKVLGLRALLDATAGDPLTLLCAFSSIAAWSGNVGQSDYAMANETLTQALLAEQAARPDCAVRAIGWGPWHGGMVDRSLAEHFHARGVPLIPVPDGAAAFAHELDAPGDVSVLITARDAAATPPPAPNDQPSRPISAQIRVGDRSHPYLADHCVAGTAVLPFAMALEWFAGVAARDRSPEAGSPIAALSDIDVLRKVELPALATGGHLLTVRHAAADGPPGSLQLLGDAGTVHYRATLDDRPLDPDSPAVPAPAVPSPPFPAGQPIYDGHLLFHGPAFQAVREVTGLSRDAAAGVLVGAAELGWEPAVHDGATRPEHWWTDPAVVDGGLQLAVLWARELLGTASLPMSVSGFRLYRRGLAPGAVRCVARAVRSTGTTAVCDIEFTDPADGAPIARMRRVTLVARPA
jgi:NADP-dependent 3-hydroxy acid dehydrogenase YdfG